ncbi:conserved hypothetical protein [Nitrosopumilaceae archaeon]|nr:hypothetical protein [Nitrosopumilus sp.]CAI9831416.1 conserved hypothetical protein [Nitrosopumilaceae archaeon]MDA7944213.1 hypothetical protein [Nitrosopumilus sp.]MDA7953965.1 hypothetical protein [Nitrosopumilus sp.]MDA7972893.1 hypothetical protein [Nitrosopumilus sp.]
MVGSDAVPWGAQDRFQAHYVVRIDPASPADYAARSIVSTEGALGRGAVTGVTWEGGRLAGVLAADGELCRMMASQGARSARLFVEPTEGAVRIRGGWENHLEFGVSRGMYEICDRIAGHIRSL